MTAPEPALRSSQTAGVTVLIPTFNEAAAIEECLDRVLAQTCPAQQVIVADGGSSDGTVEIVERLAARHANLVLIPNEGRIQAAGLNEALRRSTGEVLIRVDARAFIEPDYIERCLAALEHSDAAVVGGRMVARPSPGLAARAIALANGARWGAGPAPFHHSQRSGFVDTVYLGAFRRERVEEVGGWSVGVGVNEDAELNHRLRARGHRVWYDASITVGYEPRRTFAALRRQYFRYGWSRAATVKSHPASVRPRQLAPAALPALLLLAVLPGGTATRVARAALVAHVVLVVGGAGSRRQETVAVRAGAVLAAMVMHWIWALGFWKGMASPQGESLPRG